MNKMILKGIGFVTGMTLLYGCAAMGVDVKNYSEDKPRVDQNVEGNAGYITGTPKPEDLSRGKRTRRVYVLEFTKNPAGEASAPENYGTGKSYDYTIPAELQNPPPRQAAQPPQGNKGFLTAIPAEKPPATPVKEFTPTSFVDYTVEKNDTLQKISKKFYDGYSKWPRIYEANKSVISDPNRIKPGTKLRIPVE